METKNKTKLFLLFTFGISYALAGAFYLLGGKYNDTGGVIMATFYMFIPAISAFLVQYVIFKDEMKSSLMISFKINRWFFIAWLIPPVLSFLTIGISLLFPSVSYSPDMAGIFKKFESMLSVEQMEEIRHSIDNLPFHPIWMGLLQGLLAGITINALAGFGEELGWRGLLLNRMNHAHFMKAALLIGVVWGVWHAPIILKGHNYPQYPVIGVFMMIAWCILLSPLFLYITIKSKSVIAASILHGSLNGTVGLAIITIDGGNELLVGVTGLAGFIALTLITLCFFIYDKYISKENIMLNKINI